MFDHLIMPNGQRGAHYLHPRETDSKDKTTGKVEIVTYKIEKNLKKDGMNYQTDRDKIKSCTKHIRKTISSRVRKVGPMDVN